MSIARAIFRASFWGAICVGAIDTGLHGMISDWLGGQFPVLKPLFGYSLVSMSLGGIIHALLCEIDLGFWAFVL
jgi:hypothetical protein